MDIGARQGARMHPVEPSLKSWIHNGHLLTMAVAKWIGSLGVRLIALDCPDVQEAPAAKPRLVRGDGRPCGQSLELIQIPNPDDRRMASWQPRVLLCEAKHVGPAATSMGEVTLPPRAEQREPAGPVAPHRSHAMRIAGTVIFCRVCGGYAGKRKSALLKGECPGPARIPNVPVRRLREGRHPVTNVFIGEVQRM